MVSPITGDSESKMTWQTEEYYESQRRTLRPATFARLHRAIASRNRSPDKSLTIFHPRSFSARDHRETVLRSLAGAALNADAERNVDRCRGVHPDAEQPEHGDNTFYDYLINQKLRIYPNQELRAHVLNASTKETERFFRPTKENQKRKIDACVALSFTILGAIPPAV